MNRRQLRTVTLGAILAPLTLGLAACGDKGDTGAATSGEPIAKIEAPQGQKWSDVVSKTDAGGFVMGNPEAPIKLIEYGSLTCPHCAAFAAEGDDELRETFVDSGRVSFEFRNFVMNSLDLTMAMMVRCGAPESFFALKEQTFANQHDIVEKWTASGEAKAQQAAGLPPQQRYYAIASLAGLPEFYSARGISMDQAKICLSDAAAADKLVKDTSTQSEEFQITGTPTFLINGSKVEANTWPAIKAALEQAGAR